MIPAWPARAPRLEPLAGMLAGAAGGLVYWLAVLLWPASIAVLLAMLAVALVTGAGDELGLAASIAALGADEVPAAPATAAGTHATRGMLGLVFVLLTQYTALMALTAAKLPVPLPPNVALGLIMIAGQAASRALRVTMSAGRGATSGVDVAIALLIGCAPAALLGIPGLVGLAAAIVLRMALGAWLKRRGPGSAAPAGHAGATQQLSALCFYLGALAAWTYI